LAAKGGPGGCFGLKACADYCSQSKNLIECIDFGQKSGIIKKEEIDQMEQLAKNGGPGGCKTREECKEYCGVAQNALECFNFMAENGYLTPKYVEAMENQIESIEGSIKQKFEQFRQYYDSEEDYNTEVQKDIDERLKYYKEIIEEYKKKNNLE